MQFSTFVFFEVEAGLLLSQPAVMKSNTMLTKITFFILSTSIRGKSYINSLLPCGLSTEKNMLVIHGIMAGLFGFLQAP